MDEYWSDATVTSSDEEDDIDPPEIWCPRELDYWRIEEVMDAHRPPPTIEYITNIGVFNIRECIIAPLLQDATEVLDPISANNWEAFWLKGRENKEARFSFRDFDEIGEYCTMLCDTIYDVVTPMRIRSCMLHILRHGKFV